MKLKIDVFLVSLIAVIFVAYFYPLESTFLVDLPMSQIITIGVSMIFFFYGLKLSPQKIIEGLSFWKLHLCILLSTFVLFPVLVLCFYPLVQEYEQYQLLWIGMFFLAALPSTVSSSVMMVNLAKGNVPAAVFNASISGLVGIAITPLMLGFFVDLEGKSFDFSELYLELLIEILLPVVLGLIFQRWLGTWAKGNSHHLATFDKSVILLIIYTSFSHSFSTNLFATIQTLDLFILFLGVTLLFVVAYAIINFASKFFGFSRENQITAQFCGTKKSLVHGTVFYNLFFQGMSGSGIILIPLMIFHSLQLIIIGFIATKYSKEVRNREPEVESSIQPLPGLK